ncbi:MAG: MBL fold metallo-hydrolase, partial [Methanobacteriota archaeon]
MKIGNFEAYLIFGGSFRLDGGAMFGVVPKVLWEKKKPADEKNRISMCTNHLLLVNETRKILVDTGNGYKGDDKFREIYGLDYSKGHLLQ